MHILTREDLKHSKNGDIKELAESNFVFKNSENPVAQLLLDVPRGFQLQGEVVPEDKRNEKAIRQYVEQAFGKELGEALLTSYSQLPAYTLPMALAEAQHPYFSNVDGDQLEQQVIIPTKSKYTMTVYTSEGRLWYEVQFKEIKTGNGSVFPGQASCVCVYDKTQKAFVLEKIVCSNDVLKALLIDNQYNGQQSIAEAKKQEELREQTIADYKRKFLEVLTDPGQHLKAFYERYSIVPTAEQYNELLNKYFDENGDLRAEPLKEKIAIDINFETLEANRTKSFSIYHRDDRDKTLTARDIFILDSLDFLVCNYFFKKIVGDLRQDVSMENRAIGAIGEIFKARTSYLKACAVQAYKEMFPRDELQKAFSLSPERDRLHVLSNVVQTHLQNKAKEAEKKFLNEQKQIIKKMKALTTDLKKGQSIDSYAQRFEPLIQETNGMLSQHPGKKVPFIFSLFSKKRRDYNALKAASNRLLAAGFKSVQIALEGRHKEAVPHDVHRALLNYLHDPQFCQRLVNKLLNDRAYLNNACRWVENAAATGDKDSARQMLTVLLDHSDARAYLIKRYPAKSQDKRGYLNAGIAAYCANQPSGNSIVNLISHALKGDAVLNLLKRIPAVAMKVSGKEWVSLAKKDKRVIDIIFSSKLYQRNLSSNDLAELALQSPDVRSKIRSNEMLANKLLQAVSSKGIFALYLLDPNLINHSLKQAHAKFRKRFFIYQPIIGYLNTLQKGSIPKNSTDMLNLIVTESADNNKSAIALLLMVFNDNFLRNQLLTKPANEEIVEQLGQLAMKNADVLDAVMEYPLEFNMILTKQAQFSSYLPLPRTEGENGTALEKKQDEIRAKLYKNQTFMQESLNRSTLADLRLLISCEQYSNAISNDATLQQLLITRLGSHGFSKESKSIKITHDSQTVSFNNKDLEKLFNKIDSKKLSPKESELYEAVIQSQSMPGLDEENPVPQEPVMQRR